MLSFMKNECNIQDLLSHYLLISPDIDYFSVSQFPITYLFTIPGNSKYL